MEVEPVGGAAVGEEQEDQEMEDDGVDSDQ